MTPEQVKEREARAAQFRKERLAIAAQIYTSAIVDGEPLIDYDSAVHRAGQLITENRRDPLEPHEYA